MIKEYLDDELADDESDSRRIKKVEKRASDKANSNPEKKRKSTRANQQSSSGQNAGSNWPFFFLPGLIFVPPQVSSKDLKISALDVDS